MKISRSAVFLFELMVVILIFAMASAACVQIFAGAFNMSKDSKELTMSSLNAQTVAERFKAGSEDAGTIYFDKDWNAAGEANAYYTVALEEKESPPYMREAFVRVYEKSAAEPIFSLNVKRYTG